MNLRQIRYFLAVADGESFSAAANREFVTQPTLSAGIKALEASLGARLFDRGPRRATLTHAGRRLLPHARLIVREANAARASVKTGPGRRRLSLGVLESLPLATVARLTDAFLRDRPDISVAITEGPRDRLDRLLRQGRLDAALTILGSGGDGMERQRLFADRQVLAVPAEHPFARRGRLEAAMLEDQPLIARTHCEHLAETRRILERDGVRPHVVMRTARDNAALHYVAAGLGVVFIPNSFQLAGVALVPVDGLGLTRTIGLIWLDGPASDHARALAVAGARIRWVTQDGEEDRLQWAR